MTTLLEFIQTTLLAIAVLFASCYLSASELVGETKIPVKNSSDISNLATDVNKVFTSINKTYNLRMDNGKYQYLIKSLQQMYKSPEDQKLILGLMKKQVPRNKRLTLNVSLVPSKGLIVLKSKYFDKSLEVEAINPLLGTFAINGHKFYYSPYMKENFNKSFTEIMGIISKKNKTTNNINAEIFKVISQAFISDAFAEESNLTGTEKTVLGASLLVGGAILTYFLIKFIVVTLAVSAAGAIGIAVLYNQSKDDGFCAKFMFEKNRPLLDKIKKQCSFSELKKKLRRIKHILKKSDLMSDNFLESMLNLWNPQFNPKYVSNLKNVDCNEYTKKISGKSNMRIIPCMTQDDVRDMCWLINGINDCNPSSNVHHGGVYDGRVPKDQKPAAGSSKELRRGGKGHVER
ncbi:MAG: hypothetical protein ISR65_03940 [Bacteriovoracaceae bacterium]|nr:hypothetical protein [Bacteriovoracaceae bacterium]